MSRLSFWLSRRFRHALLAPGRRAAALPRLNGRPRVPLLLLLVLRALVFDPRGSDGLLGLVRPQLPSKVCRRVVRAAADASGFHRLLQLLGIHSRKLVALLLVAVVLGVALKRQHPRNRALATPEARFLDERFEPIGRARVDADARDLIGALLRVGRSFGRRGLLAGRRRGRRAGRRRLRFDPRPGIARRRLL